MAGMNALTFLWALLLGLPLGLLYSFLRPLRGGLTCLADLGFSLGLMAGWVYLTFGICGGDLRMGHLAALGAGFWLWEITLGRCLRGFFRGFWTVIFRILGFLPRRFRKLCKKVCGFGKKYLHLGKNRLQ